VEVRIRLGTGIARLAPAPLLVMQLHAFRGLERVCSGQAASCFQS
jgi:hypothetical protein